MRPEQKKLVQTSFEQIKPIADQAAELFYGRLFILDPTLKRLFTGDRVSQGRKLMHMLGLAVKGLDRFEELKSLLHELGARHHGYGVADRDYETVGKALIWTLGLGLGDAFNAEVKKAWIAVYQTLAECMQAGAREARMNAVTRDPNETTGSFGERNGWREYFPAAAKKTLSRSEKKMRTDNYEKYAGGFTTFALLICALICCAATARATTYTVTTTADNGNNASPTAGSLRKAIRDSNSNPGSNVIQFNIPGSGVQTIISLFDLLSGTALAIHPKMLFRLSGNHSVLRSKAERSFTAKQEKRGSSTSNNKGRKDGN